MLLILAQTEQLLPGLTNLPVGQAGQGTVTQTPYLVGLTFGVGELLFLCDVCRNP